jgi:glycerol-3-phosphate dehydrogenase
VVPRIHARRHAFILQNPDRRVIFLIPYEREFTLIGTTDVEVADTEFAPSIAPDETDYLCAAASRYTERPITREQVVWSYAGVRPLYDDGSRNPSAVTRDYHLLLDDGPDGRSPPLLSVFGGKITTYRRLAEQALDRLSRRFPGTRAWTHMEPLPGGDFRGRSFTEVFDDCVRRHPGLPAPWLARLLRRHGTLAETIIGDATSESGLGEKFGGGLYQRELDHLVEHEWAREDDDVLWRRTKCGLHMSAAQRSRVQDYLSRVA